MIFGEYRENLWGYNWVKFGAKILSTFGENGLAILEVGISQFQNKADSKTKMDIIVDQFLDTFKPNIRYLCGQFSPQMCKVILVLWIFSDL